MNCKSLLTLSLTIRETFTRTNIALSIFTSSCPAQEDHCGDAKLKSLKIQVFHGSAHIYKLQRSGMEQLIQNLRTKQNLIFLQYCAASFRLVRDEGGVTTETNPLQA